eukprot:Rhum_TRINITY_DN14731_c22_g1::Rhum_TRINITY_DN14731_c22_g1_i1::g.115431::m.115431
MGKAKPKAVVPPPLPVEEEGRVPFVSTMHVVFDNLSWYYPIGNTAPTDLLQGVSPDRAQANVLLLGSGDLRSTLFSLWYHGEKPVQPVLFTCNDSSVHIVTRNLILLDLMFSGHAEAGDVYAVWYSMGLTERQNELLRSTIRRLAALRSAEEVAQAIPFVRVMEATWASVLDVLALWGGWAPTWEERQALWDRIPDEWRSRSEHVGVLNLMRSFLEFSSADGTTRDLEKEFAEYRKSLIVQPPGTPATRQSAPCVNVTLFTQKDRYTLHYATSHVTGYGLYEYSGSESLSAYCFGQFKGWLAAARSRLTTCPSSVVWELAASDCLTWCQKLMPCRPRYYDSVNTSNLTNYVGLLPLLTNVRPLVRPTAFVETVNLIDVNGESAVDFLQMELKLPSVLWPSVLGWRCIGMEPQGMQTEYGNGQWDTTPAMTIPGTPEQVQRKETKYLWVPAPLLPGKCFDLEESPLVEGSFAEMLAGTAVVGRSQVHTITTTALPVMLRLMTASQAKTAFAEASRRSVSFCEAEDLALLMLGERRPSEYEAVTVPWQPEWTEKDELNQPVLTANVVGRASELGNVASLLGITPMMYNGIWRTANSVGTVTKDVHWVMARGKRELPGGSLNTRTTKMLAIVDMATQHSRVLTAPPLGVPQMLLKEGEVLPDDGASIARWWINSDGDVSIEVALSDAWMNALNAGETLSLASCVSQVLWEDEPSSKPAHYGVELQCRKKKAASASRTQFFATPTPVSEAASRLLLSRKRRCVTLVLPLAPYPAQHQVRSGLRIGGAIGTRRPLSNHEMVVISGMQLSKRDKAAVNDTTGVYSEQPLVAMKKSIAALLQTTEKYYLFATKAQGNCVLAFRHGLQVDSASGVVYADFSICFLERSFTQELAPKWLNHTDDAKSRTVLLADNELPLLRQYCEMHARRLKGVKPHKEVPAWAHKHFKRVLLPPLMLLGDDMQQQFRSALNFEGEDLKRRGNAYAKDKHFALAVATYKQVLPLAKGPRDTQLAVACLSNIAHCNVQIGTRAAAKDARASAEKGLSLLKGSTEAWVASLEYKLHYRLALACERTGDMPDARDAIHRALAAKGGKDDPAIRAAASRIEAASYSADVD